MAEVQEPINAQETADASQSEEQKVQSTVEELQKQHPSMFSETESVNEDTSAQFQREQQQAELTEQEEISPTEEQSPETESKEQKPEEKEQKDGLPGLDELDLPEDLGIQGEEGEEVPELPDTEEAKAFAEQFQKYLGISVEEFRTAAQDYKKTIEYVNQARQEQYYNKAVNSLSQEWGVDQNEVETRLEKVRERFNKYPEDMRNRLDSPEGAKLIWAKIEQEQQRQQPEVPTFQKSSSAGTQGQQRKPRFTREQLAQMTPEEYSRNNEEIIEAYKLGLVR